MDIVTQGLVGSIVAQTRAGTKEVRYASAIGFVAGLLADVDNFIRSSGDTLLVLKFHRFFTHSLFFIPIGGLVATLLVWYFFRKKLPFMRIYLFAISGYATCGLLDACTSYGTSLLWPLSDEKISWNIISILDPVFSLTILFFLAIGFIKHKRMFAVAGVVFGCAYMLLGLWQNRQVTDIARQVANKNGHQAQGLVIKPTLGNIILWRSLYEHDGVYYINAIRKGFISEPKIYPGKSIAKYRGKATAGWAAAPSINKASAEVTQSYKLSTKDGKATDVNKSSTIYRDIKRFDAFSAGYLAIHPDYPDVIGDIRYAMLPTSIKPLWGIELNYEQDRVEFKNFRNMDKETLDEFMKMIFGR